MNMKKWARKIAPWIEHHYACHGVKVKLRLCRCLNDWQRLIFQVYPMPGTKIDGIFDRAADIQAALQIPLFQPFRDEVLIFLAVSQKSVSENSLQKMLNSQDFYSSKAKLPLALGYDMMGRMIFADLEKMPHAMYAGATRSGKSFGLISLIMSLICKHPASEVNLVIFDIGANTLDVFDSIPHLSHPIVKDKDEGIHVIQSLAEEMERRINLSRSELCDLSAIVCVMDEYTSFIGSIDSREPRQKVADNISNLLRRGRKAKIHMVLATQDPTNKPMGVEIGNITSRMAFKVARYQTSIAILNCGGAEKLPGNGAMLHWSEEYPEPLYIQGAYMPVDAVEQLVARIVRINETNQSFGNKFVIQETDGVDFFTPSDALPETVQADNKDEKNFADIILWTLEHDVISVEKIKRQFSMGNRANKIIDKLCEAGLVSEKFSNQPRKVLPQGAEDIPDAIMELLTSYGFTAEDVTTALNKRNPTDLAVMERGDSNDTSC